MNSPLGLVRLGWYGGIVPPGSPNPRRDILCQKKRWTVGLQSFFTRRRTPAAAEPSAVVVATEREPLTPAQLADLEAAWAELQQAAKEAGVSFHACTRDGSRWQDDPQSVRAMAETIKRTQKYTAEGTQDGPQR
jgi:hypothetical protein